MGECTLPFTNFFISDFVLQDTKKDFLQGLQKLAQASLPKMFHVSDE